MLIRQRCNARGQSTAEYAIVIGLVIAAAVAMQVYVRRGMQGKVKGVTDRMDWGLQGKLHGTPILAQYEPYYQTSDYTVTQQRDSIEGVSSGYVVKKTGIFEQTTRDKDGFTEQSGADTMKDDKDWK